MHSPKKSGKKYLFCLILAMQVVLCIFFGTQKQGFHEDEYYTYYSSNRTAGLPVPDRAWQETEEIAKEFAVLAGERFRYGQIALVQSWDVHPPLYYDIFHTLCGFFPGVFSKWPGLLTNLIASVLSSLLLYRITGRLKLRAPLRLAVSLLWAMHPMLVSSVMFIRMYAWLTVFVLACADLHLRLLEEAREAMAARSEGDGRSAAVREFLRRMLPIMAVSFLGFLTQYYYLIFFFWTGVCTALYFIYEKRYRTACAYALCCGAALLCAVAAYPASAAHIFRGYRGREAIASFADAANLAERLTFFAGLLNDYLLYGVGWLWMILLAAGGASVWLGRRGIRRREDAAAAKEMPQTCRHAHPPARAYLPLAASAAYFLTVAKTALLLGNTSNRYELPVYPLLLLYMVWASDALLMRLCGSAARSRRTVSLALLTGVLLLCNLKGLFRDGRVLFLYKEDTARIAYAQAHRELPVVVIYHEDAPEKVWYLTDELLQYPRLYFMRADNPAPVTDETIADAKELLVYAAAHENRDAILMLLAKENSDGRKTERISEKDTWTLYRLYE